MNDPQITTYSGRQFFITRATTDDIYIEDIAHGLSNICRYTGQCKTFYSVAEHSVRMAEVSSSPSMKLLALLHDAPEAYLGDMTTEVKRCLPVYKDMERYLLGVIFDKYGVTRCSSMNLNVSLVETLDAQMRTPEVLSLFPKRGGWMFSWKKVEFDYGRIKPWSPRKAEKRFLKMFRGLYEHI